MLRNFCRLRTALFVLLLAPLLSIFPVKFQQAQLNSASPNSLTYDLIITNGRIVDGTGNPWFRADVAVKDGRIARIGRIAATEAREVIDAQNGIVAPGFIDVHAHVENIYRQPAAENFVRMGVTSLVTGNCGSSATDIGEFLGRIKDQPLAVNLGTLIAHGDVRRKVMGLEARAPTATELQQMEAMVEAGMREGRGCSRRHPRKYLDWRRGGSAGRNFAFQD
jgi:N-acyl-D-amino-acid deacylase